MNGKILLLQAEIKANLKKIAEVYTELDSLHQQPPDDKTREIVIAFYLHNLYGLFKNTFVRIAENFANHIEHQDRWHSELLRRMTLDVPPLRPAVIGEDSYRALNELRAFRHLFRTAYLMNFDTVRLALV